MPTSLRSKFPASRELAGNFCRIWTRSTIFACDSLADSISYGEIPYATEQGIFFALAGNFFQRAGNL
jgi:hypothetical protein